MAIQNVGDLATKNQIWIKIEWSVGLIYICIKFSSGAIFVILNDSVISDMLELSAYHYQSEYSGTFLG